MGKHALNENNKQKTKLSKGDRRADHKDLQCSKIVKLSASPHLDVTVANNIADGFPYKNQKE